MHIQPEQAQMLPPGKKKFFRSPSPPHLKHLKRFNTITVEGLHVLVQNCPEDEGSKKI
jgi:hypothetical protein